jgi:hypothetical protein
MVRVHLKVVTNNYEIHKILVQARHGRPLLRHAIVWEYVAAWKIDAPDERGKRWTTDIGNSDALAADDFWSQ